MRMIRETVVSCIGKLSGVDMAESIKGIDFLDRILIVSYD